MALIQVPGAPGYAIDTTSGNTFRVGRAGGLRHPTTGAVNQGMPLNEWDPASQAIGRQALDEFRRATTPAGPSDMEVEMWEAQMESIRRANEIQDLMLRRENIRRSAFERYMAGERFTPKNIDEQEGLIAAKSAGISMLEMDQLEKAHKGELPVSVATKRTIDENRAVTEERLRRELGPGWSTGTPGGEELQRFEESADVLADAERQGLLMRGIRPAIDAAGLANQSIGQFVPGEIPGLGGALQRMSLNRLAQDQMASQNYQAYSGNLDAYRGNLAKLAAEDEASGISGGGIGSLVGSLVGGLAAAAIPYAGPFLAPIGATTGGMVGGYIGGGASGGGWQPQNLYSFGGGFSGRGGGGGGFGGGGGPTRIAYGGPGATSYPYP